jgi:hypothetical protein
LKFPSFSTKVNNYSNENTRAFDAILKFQNQKEYIPQTSEFMLSQSFLPEKKEADIEEKMLLNEI